MAQSFDQNLHSRHKPQPQTTMRQLKGKATKETSKMRKERRAAFREGHEKAMTIAVPVILSVVVAVIMFVVLKTSYSK